jgi:hypothetical protein
VRSNDSLDYQGHLKILVGMQRQHRAWLCGECMGWERVGMGAREGAW